MKQKRENLENALYVAIGEYTSNKRIRTDVSSQLKQHNINPALVTGIFTKTVLLHILSIHELCLFNIAFYNSTQKSSINPELFFNTEEIKSAKLFKNESPTTEKNIIVFENVAKIGDYQYIIPYVSLQQVTKLISDGTITYNIRTQRGATLKRFKDAIIEVATIKKDAVESIKETMLNNKFTMNMISLNILKNGTEIFNYNEKSKTLTIDVDNNETFLNIVDGMHRMSAGLKATQENPNLNLGTIINILHYTELEAQAFIEQEDNRTPINPQVKVAYNTNNEINLFVKDINREGSLGNNELFNKIALTDQEVKFMDKYVTFDIFIKALEHNFDLSSPRKNSKIKKFLIKFFNELIGYMKDELNNFDEIKKHLLSNNMFLGYIAYASKLYESENWEEKIENFVCKINDVHDNILVNELNINSRNINKTFIQKISEYFKTL